MFYVVK